LLNGFGRTGKLRKKTPINQKRTGGALTPNMFVATAICLGSERRQSGGKNDTTRIRPPTSSRSKKGGEV